MPTIDKIKIEYERMKEQRAFYFYQFMEHKVLMRALKKDILKMLSGVSNAWKTSPLYIQGSRWPLTNCKYGYIQIGCYCKSIDWWINNGLTIAKTENMSDDEINEYTAYIKLFKLIGK